MAIKYHLKKYALDLMDEIYNMYEKLNIETNIVDVMYNKILNPNLTYAKLLNDSIKKKKDL